MPLIIRLIRDLTRRGLDVLHVVLHRQLLPNCSLHLPCPDHFYCQKECESGNSAGNPQPDQVGLVCHQDGRPSSQAGAGHQAGEQPLRLK